jgi:hypothetical protein
MWHVIDPTCQPPYHLQRLFYSKEKHEGPDCIVGETFKNIKNPMPDSCRPPAAGLPPFRRQTLAAGLPSSFRRRNPADLPPPASCRSPASRAGILPTSRRRPPAVLPQAGPLPARRDAGAGRRRPDARQGRGGAPPARRDAWEGRGAAGLAEAGAGHRRPGARQGMAGCACARGGALGRLRCGSRRGGAGRWRNPIGRGAAPASQAAEEESGLRG